MTKTNDDPKRVVYRVWGDVGSVQGLALQQSGVNVLGIERPKSTFDEIYIYGRNVHVYDVYEDGSFCYFDPLTGKPAQEPDEMAEDRRAIVSTVEDYNERGFGGITGGNRASHPQYEKAFLTLCQLGFGPQSVEWLEGRYLSRNTVLNHRVEYFGEDEPWIDAYEYNERHGLPFVIYD